MTIDRLTLAALIIGVFATGFASAFTFIAAVDGDLKGRHLFALGMALFPVVVACITMLTSGR